MYDMLALYDEDFLYPVLFSRRYRLSRTTGDLEREEAGIWQDANTFEEAMTLLDFVCDSREDRFVSGRFKNMADFGHAFHQSLLEKRDPNAELFQSRAEDFRKACVALGGKPLPTGDIAYSIEVIHYLALSSLGHPPMCSDLGYWSKVPEAAFQSRLLARFYSRRFHAFGHSSLELLEKGMRSSTSTSSRICP